MYIWLLFFFGFFPLCIIVHEYVYISYLTLTLVALNIKSTIENFYNSFCVVFSIRDTHVAPNFANVLRMQDID